MSSTPRKWWLTLYLPSRPRCPRCFGELLAKATVIHHDIAWCEACYNTDDPRYTISIAEIARRAPRDEIRTLHGVSFWVPPLDTDEADVYIRFLALRERGELNYPIESALRDDGLIE